MNPPSKDKKKESKPKKIQLSCKNCGEKLRFIARYCPRCGGKLTGK